MPRVPKADDLCDVDLILKKPGGRGGFAFQNAISESVENLLKKHLTPEKVLNGLGSLLTEPANALRSLLGIAQSVGSSPGIAPGFQYSRGEIGGTIFEKGEGLLHGVTTDFKAEVLP